MYSKVIGNEGIDSFLVIKSYTQRAALKKKSLHEKNGDCH